MGVGQKLFSAGETVFDRILCITGAVIFSQAPEFMQQYLQRLGGHLDEARRHLTEYERTATQSGLTLPELIERTHSNSDTAVAKLGGVMSDTVTRVETLETAQNAIQHASLFERPFVFLRHVDASIADATWSIYKPAVPTTAEGLVYALIGMLTLLIIYYAALKYPATKLLARRSAKQRPATSLV